ncbi:MAG: hypothetical protein R2860_09310 [Desulfobacterales bacterium]
MTALTIESRDNLLLGAHFSIAGGLYKALLRAAEYQCTALQLFTKNASTWKEKTAEKEIQKFSDTRAQTGIGHIFSTHPTLSTLPDQTPKKPLYPVMPYPGTHPMRSFGYPRCRAPSRRPYGRRH